MNERKTLIFIFQILPPVAFCLSRAIRNWIWWHNYLTHVNSPLSILIIKWVDEGLSTRIVRVHAYKAVQHPGALSSRDYDVRCCPITALETLRAVLQGQTVIDQYDLIKTIAASERGGDTKYTIACSFKQIKTWPLRNGDLGSKDLDSFVQKWTAIQTVLDFFLQMKVIETIKKVSLGCASNAHQGHGSEQSRTKFVSLTWWRFRIQKLTKCIQDVKNGEAKGTPTVADLLSKHFLWTTVIQYLFPLCVDFLESAASHPFQPLGDIEPDREGLSF